MRLLYVSAAMTTHEGPEENTLPYPGNEKTEIGERNDLIYSLVK